MHNSGQLLCTHCHGEMRAQCVRHETGQLTQKTPAAGSGFHGILQDIHWCPQCGAIVTQDERGENKAG